MRHKAETLLKWGFVQVLCHNEWGVEQWDGQKKQESINLADVSRYLKPFAPVWLARPTTSRIFSSILSPSIYYPNFSLQQKEKKGKKELGTTPLPPLFLLCHTVLLLPPPHISMSDTSCLGLRCSVTVLSSLIYRHPPPDSCFHPSVPPTSYIFHYISPFHRLMWSRDCSTPWPICEIDTCALCFYEKIETFFSIRACSQTVKLASTPQ